MKRLNAEGVSAAISGLVLGAYALLLPSGRWQGDDYFGALLVGQGKWGVLLSSLEWAPRPVGQPLGWFYEYLSDTSHRPHIAVFLAALWLGSLTWIALAGWTGRQRHPFSLAMVLFALTLMIGKPGEMFYWPVGSAAYLPCWAGLAGATVLLRSSRAKGGALMACLLLASVSLEVGAVTVLIYASLAGAAALRDRNWQPLWPLILPTAFAAAVCLTVALGRIHPMREVIDPASGLAGNWRASFVAGIPAFANEALRIAGLPLMAGAVIKLMLVLCLPPFGTRPTRETRKTAAIWACALLLAAFTSEVFAYHQFGTQCCERQFTQRQSMVLMALLSLTGLLPAPIGWFRWHHPAALSIILIGLFYARASALVVDWENQPSVLAARQRTWDSGRAPGNVMTMVMAPHGQITNFDTMPPGHFRMCRTSSGCNVPWYASGVMGLFHKSDLTIVQDP